MRRVNIEQDEVQSEQELTSVPLLTVPVEQQEAEVKTRQLQSGVLTPKRALRTTTTELQKREVRHDNAARSLYIALTGDNSRKTQLSVAFDNLANLLNAGYPVGEAMRLSTGKASPGMQACFAQIAAHIEAGMDVEQAFRMQEQYLPEVTLPIIQNALREGTLATAARQLALALRKLSEVEHKFDYSAFNPALTMPLIFGALLLLLPGLPGVVTLFFPAFTWLAFLENPVVYTGLAALFAVGSGLLWHRVNVAWLPQQWSSDPRKGRTQLSKFTKRTQNRYFASARWSRTFAALWEVGVPISTALEASALAARNGYYEQQLLRAATLTRQGVTLADSLLETRMLPPHLVDAIRTGEITGDLGISLDKLANNMEDEGKETAAKWMFGKIFGGTAFGLFIVAALALVLLFFVEQIVRTHLHP